MLAQIKRKLNPSQIVYVGVRELDDKEQLFIVDKNIAVISVNDIEQKDSILNDTLQAIGNNNVYIHLDLDVLEPQEFPHIPVPSQNGISTDCLLKTLQKLADTGSLVGMGVFEYKPMKQTSDILSTIMRIGLNLSKQ